MLDQRWQHKIGTPERINTMKLGVFWDGIANFKSSKENLEFLASIPQVHKYYYLSTQGNPGGQFQSIWILNFKSKNTTRSMSKEF